MFSKKLLLFFPLCCFVSLSTSAQDRRQVSEPTTPKVCATLYADKTVGTDRIMANSDEEKKDSQRIQEALNHCAKGQAVKLVSKKKYNAFLSGPIDLPSGVGIILAKNITLYASRDPRDYDYPDGLNQCATTESEDRIFGVANTAPDVNSKSAKKGCRPLFSIKNASDTGIFGEGTIDGRGDKTLINKDYSWWQMARKAEPGNKKYYSVRLVVIKNSHNIILSGIRLHNSPNFHVTINDTQGFTAWGVHLHTPTDPKADARNTDGIDPGSSSDVTVAHSWIHTDDDNIAIKTGLSYMSALHNHFYVGHGMSIGSETYSGVHHLLVDDLTLDHTTSGIRIKSNVTRGGEVRDLTYSNICMKDVGVLFSISPYYINKTTEPFEDPGYLGDKIPDYKNILLSNITSINSGDILIAGKNEQHITQIVFSNVNVMGILESQVHSAYSDITLTNSNIPFKSDDVKHIKVTTENNSNNKIYNCANRFLPMQ